MRIISDADERNATTFIISFVVLCALAIAALMYLGVKGEQHRAENPAILTVKEEFEIREKTKILNFEILEAKAKVWKALADDPKLLTPEMIKVLEKD